MIIERPTPFIFTSYRPLTEKVNIGFYTGKRLSKKRKSIEHLLPKSKGGRSTLSNYAVADKKTNNLRGNMDLREWLRLNPQYLDNMKNYVKEYTGLVIRGLNHGEEVWKTVKKVYGIDLRT